MTRYLVTATDASGATLYYTGRAGMEFLSPNKAEAFPYFTEQAVKRQADMMNRVGFTFAPFFTTTA